MGKKVAQIDDSGQVLNVIVVPDNFQGGQWDGVEVVDHGPGADIGATYDRQAGTFTPAVAPKPTARQTKIQGWREKLEAGQDLTADETRELLLMTLKRLA